MRIVKTVGIFAVISVLMFLFTDLRGVLNYADADSADSVCFEYIKKFGWETSEKAVKTVFVTIPEDFDAVYRQYNSIQKKQGFDLSLYRGNSVEKKVFTVYNYPEIEEKKTVIADIYLYEGKIIAADICCTALDGFIHGVNECYYGNDEIG